MVFGSAVAIAFGLNGVLVVFLLIRDESGQLTVEIQRLPFYCAVFIALSAVSGLATYSLLKSLPWWRWAQWAMWASVTATAALVWSYR
jgi:hypothetical protein